MTSLFGGLPGMKRAILEQPCKLSISIDIGYEEICILHTGQEGQQLTHLLPPNSSQLIQDGRQREIRRGHQLLQGAHGSVEEDCCWTWQGGSYCCCSGKEGFWSKDLASDERSQTHGSRDLPCWKPSFHGWIRVSDRWKYTVGHLKERWTVDRIKGSSPLLSEVVGLFSYRLVGQDSFHVRGFSRKMESHIFLLFTVLLVSSV